MADQGTITVYEENGHIVLAINYHGVQGSDVERALVSIMNTYKAALTANGVEHTTEPKTYGKGVH